MERTKNKIETLTSRRGFTVLEVIIALTIIAIVSGSALALISSHTRLEQASIQSIEATNIAENAIECFRYSSDMDGFKSAYKAVSGSDLTENAEDSSVLEYKDGALDVTFQISGNTITVTVKNASGKKIIDKETYTKYINN